MHARSHRSRTSRQIFGMQEGELRPDPPPFGAKTQGPSHFAPCPCALPISDVARGPGQPPHGQAEWRELLCRSSGDGAKSPVFTHSCLAWACSPLGRGSRLAARRELRCQRLRPWASGLGDGILVAEPFGRRPSESLGLRGLEGFVLVPSLLCWIVFSGLGTSEIGWRAVGAALRAQGFPFSLTCHFACDVDADCRNVLTGLGLGHVFGDIMALIAAVVDETWHVTRKERSIMCAPVRASSQCYQCGVTCPCGPVQVTVSGSPCQDWSSAGNMLGLGGKRAHVLLAWIRWHIVWEPPLIIHENVTRFDLQVLESRLGEVYWVYSVVCNPGDVGWTCVRRPRLYVALVHTAKLDVCCNPAWLFWEVCRHIGGGQPLQVSDLLVATPAEVCHEAWLVGRERRRQLRQQCSAAGAAERIALAVGAAGMEPERLLSPGERLRLAAYLRRWKQKDWGEASGCSNLVLNLGDNPEAGWLSWSAPKEWGGHFVIPTLRRAWTVQWLPALRRWLTRSERLVLMGFPAYPELAQLYGLPGACQISWRTSKRRWVMQCMSQTWVFGRR